MHELQVPPEKVADYMLPGDVPLFPVKVGEVGYLGDNKVSGRNNFHQFM